ncbi:male sterility protein-domain-containing protein [Xylariaceae sp. FL0255]|nr:male sterility protein-domain-containing protein [Xylariaceae sp. FL0255]
MRPGTGTEWCWVTPLQHAEPFMRFEPVDDSDRNLHHLVILPGLPTKMLSNRSDGSYATNDLFERHPTYQGKWKFAGRADDIIVLINGEKADPAPLEEALSLNTHVHAAVAFGAGRDSLGVVVIPSSSASLLTTAELFDSIEFSLTAGNDKLPAYAHVTLDSVILKDAHFEVPTTAKSTIMRFRILELCRDDIERHYSRRDLGKSVKGSVSDDAVTSFVRASVNTVLKLDEGELSDDTDFFTIGMDSLQASHIKSRLLKCVDLRGGVLETNVVFEYPTVKSLTQHILNIRKGRCASPGIDLMKLSAESLVEKYTRFPRMTPGAATMPSGQVVLLTGATGAIGRHILRCLAKEAAITKIYCLVRARDDRTAKQRVVEGLDHARITDLNAPEMEKIFALAGKLGEPHLGLSSHIYEDIRTCVTTIIHGAWAVNFNMALRSFEEPFISSVNQLLTLAMESSWSRKPTFCLLSSVASVLRARDDKIKEALYEWDSASHMGYGQSK